MPPAALAALKFNVRADLFTHLAAMEEAGLPTDKALDLIRLPPGVQPRLSRMRKGLGQGLGIAAAGLESGLFTAVEAALLHAACNAGSPARSYRRLADYYARRAARVAKMKSRMMPALAMLVIGDFTSPLPRLVAGSLGIGGYLFKCLLPLFAIGAAVYLFNELPRRLEPGSPAMRKVPLDEILTQLPLFGPMLIRRNARDFFDSLALLVEAGMPILQALPIAVDAMGNSTVRQQFSQIQTRIEGGTSFAQAVGELSFPGRGTAYAMIQAGETSGGLPQALFHCSDSEAAAIDHFDEQVAEWTPRLVYTLVALWVGYGIIHSGAFMPAVPPDL